MMKNKKIVDRFVNFRKIVNFENFKLKKFSELENRIIQLKNLVLLSYTAPIHFLTIMNPNGTNDNSFERAR